MRFPTYRKLRDREPSFQISPLAGASLPIRLCQPSLSGVCANAQKAHSRPSTFPNWCAELVVSWTESADATRAVKFRLLRGRCPLMSQSEYRYAPFPVGSTHVFEPNLQSAPHNTATSENGSAIQEVAPHPSARIDPPIPSRDLSGCFAMEALEAKRVHREWDVRILISLRAR